MRALCTAALAALAATGGARAEGPMIRGEYDSPLGRVRVLGEGAAYRAIVVAPAGACAFAAGEEVLRATLLDDSLAGQLRVCLRGARCAADEEWSSAVLLVEDRRLSGAAHVTAKGCVAPLGKRGGVVFTAAASPRPPPSLRGGEGDERARGGEREAARDRARALLRDGAAYLSEGGFERARARFLEAIAIDPGVPEAYNGVGVTYRMRNELPRALEWYKKALGVDPDFGDAYYNIACLYALEGRKELALRYLQIAALNGYATATGIDEDPDLASVREEPGYRALRARM